MGNEYFNWAPRATFPKSCTVLFKKSLFAHGSPGCCASAGAEFTRKTTAANAKVLMPCSLCRVRCPKPPGTLPVGDSSVNSWNGEGGIAGNPPVHCSHRILICQRAQNGEFMGTLDLAEVIRSSLVAELR